MRNPSLIVASMAALLTFGAQAQQQSQPVPDAPQAQKKPAPKTDSSADKSDSKPPAKDANPFPEAVSEAAAKAANESSDSDKGSVKNKAATDNPFPESVSRDAAKAAGNDPAPAPDAKRDLPPGVSSSQSSGLDENEPDSPPKVADPARAKKDTEVGGFYFKSGDYRGALLRFQDAMASDPSNVEAIFGLAETERMLKQNTEAARNYQLYLDILPNGPRSKQALKALRTLGAGG